MRHRRPVYLTSFDYLGPHRYFLTFCTHDRRPHFRSADTVRLAWLQISRAADEQAFAVIAYCFMPDHVHLVVCGTAEDSDLRRFVTRSKQYSGYAFARMSGGRLWQRYCFEHVLRSEESTRLVVRYVLENPLRKGLASNVADYPFTGSGVCSTSDLIEYVRCGSSSS